MFYTYILKLRTGLIYIGSAKDLKKRVAEDKRGNVATTKNKLPFDLIFYAAFKTEEKATSFERYLKSSSRFAFRRKRLT